MPDTNQQKSLEGEVLEQVREKSNGGVFIGTLNIMTQPARNFLTDPLADLYQDKYHGKFKRPKHVFAFDMGLIALGAVLAAVSIYFGVIYKPFEAVKTELTLSPKAPVAGGEIVINLTIANAGADPIENVDAVIKLPPQIKFERSSLPYQRDSQTVSFGEVGSQNDASVRIVGILTGAVGQNIKVGASFAYKNAAGKNIKKNAAASVKIAGSSVGAEFAMPDNVVAGQLVSGEIRYFNHGNTSADNVVITANWPQNFVLNSSAPETKNNSWLIGTLSKGSEGKISWSGAMGKGSTSADFGIETGIKSGADILTQSQNVKTVAVTDPSIDIALDGASSARLGDTVTLTATYKNSGDHTLNGALFAAAADPGLTIVNIVPAALGDVSPGATGTVKITAQVDSKLPDALKTSTDAQFAMRANLSGKLDNAEIIAISSPAWIIKAASTIGLTAGARYWSDMGDQLGRGPLPPAVGKTTTLWIFWNVSNTTGAVKNVRVTGKMPANVTYTGKAANPFGSAPLYDPATRTMTWNVGDIPAWPGVNTASIGAACEVTITPTADERGTYAPLMTDQVITGTDAVTGLALSATSPDMNTHLTTDPRGIATGTVQ